MEDRKDMISLELSRLIRIRDTDYTDPVYCGDCGHRMPCVECEGWRAGVSDWLMESILEEAE